MLLPGPLTTDASWPSVTRGYRASSGGQLKQATRHGPHHPIGFSWSIDFYILHRARRFASRPTAL